MMKKKTFTGIGIGVFAIVIMLSVLLVALPQKFTSFQGNIHVNGANAESGVIVRACIGENDRGNSSTYSASNKTWYVMDVTNGTNGDNVVFRVDGLVVNEIATYNDIPDHVEQNLTVNQSTITLELAEGWNLISIPLELKYDGCVGIL